VNRLSVRDLFTLSQTKSLFTGQVKKGVGSGNFDNEREREFQFLLGWDKGIVREKQRDTGI